MSASDFRRVLAAEGVSNFGAMLSRLAIPWLAALTLQATPLQMSMLLLADVAAGALGALWLGSWVDRSGKRRVMLACDFARCALLAALALAAWQGRVTMVMLVVAAATAGVLTMGFEVARSAWTAQCVAAADLPRRNAQLSFTGSLSETAAFALGGWIYQGLGATLALAVNALSYAASALCLRGLREAPPLAGAVPDDAGSTRRARWHASTAGLRAVAAQPALRTLAALQALIALGMSMAGTSYMIFVARDLGLPTGELGLIFALGGVGAALGATLAPRLGRRFGAGHTLAGGLAAAALGAACVPLAGAVGGAMMAAAWLVAHQIVGDAGHTLHEVHDRTLRQTAAPPALRARADAGIRAVGQITTLAGALGGGLLGNAFGARGVLWAVAAVHALAALLAMARLAQLRAPATSTD